MTNLNVTIARQQFDHMVYHFVLTHSNWEWVNVCFSESFESLSEGLQGALWALGGVPLRHCADRLSAAVNNLSETREPSPGVLGRSEFGQEIGVAIAQLVYITGLAFDKVCLVFGFFQNLTLRKSPVDALLRQLARHWEQEFETLCTLLANSAVVHAHETNWSLNSVWAFVSEKARGLLFGVHKDAQTLKTILDPATFAGIVTSDEQASENARRTGRPVFSVARNGLV